MSLMETVGAPQFMAPWLDRFYEPEEIELLEALGGDEISPAELAGRLNRPADEAWTEYLERCWRRGVAAKTEEGLIKAASLHTRYDYWALFEGWMDVPQEIQDRLNVWEMEEYTRNHAEDIAWVKGGNGPAGTRIWPRYLLFDEAMAVIDQVEKIYLWPCNCRSMMERCDKPVNTCVRFRNSRGIGWEISKDRAREVVRQANESGLMQVGELGHNDEGKLTGAICNCCSDCCYPHQLSVAAGAEKQWPKARYIARRVEDKCSLCGLCARRCPFGAFTFSKEGKGKEAVRTLSFNPEECRGCGICATKCPEEAIEMDKLSHVGPEWDI